MHVDRDERLVVKWDLEDGQAMTGTASRRIRRIIQALQREGRL